MGKLFDELKTMKEAYDRKLRDEGQAAVKDAFKDILDEFPELQCIYWRQYTDYFNDGDPCYFRVHGFDVSLDDDRDYSYGESIYELRRSTNPREVEIAKAVSELEGNLPDDVLKHVFGDHVEVVASRDGFSVREIDHD